MSDDLNDTPINTDEIGFTYKPHISKKRWWVLFLFSFNSFLFSIDLLFYNSIPESIEAYYHDAHVEMSVINQAVSLGGFLYCFFVILMIWLDSSLHNLKLITFLSSAILSVSVLLRMLPSWSHTVFFPISKGLIFASSIINQLGGAFTFTSPSLCSATWFPDSERGLATSIAAQSSPAGIAFSFFVLPLIVRKPSHVPIAILVLLILHLVCTLLIMFTFPSKPKHPPSLSEYKRMEEQEETTARSDDSKSSRCSRLGSSLFNSFKVLLVTFKQLFTNRDFIFFALAAALQSGSTQPFSGNMTFLFTRLGHSQWIGGIGAFLNELGTIVGGILMSLLVSRPKVDKHRKGIFIAIFVTNVVFGAFLLLFFPFPWMNGGLKAPVMIHPSLLIVLVTLYGMVSGSPWALFFETVADITSPISEGTSGAAFTIFSSLLYSFVFFLFSMAGPNSTALITNCAVAVSIPLLLFTHMDRRRG
ncbi:putative MFS-type transporter [Blattamonas nauphoetae]|uniref:MFS-type transporter n=1 Tax=Blattamonas nauphoetae TaxID=2049346 RepID=A0ABQ9XHZ4_9EUKA|nr:putative MFS-type transporter [Blattamonas nauphoetae]